MTPWQIVLVALGALLLLLLSLLLIGRAKLILRYSSGLEVKFSVFGIQKTILQHKKAAPRRAKPLTDLTDLPGVDRKLKRLFKQQKKALAKVKRRQVKEAKQKLKRQKRREEKEKKRTSPKLSPQEVLTLVSHLIEKAYEITKGKFRLSIECLTIVVGSEDAATTALLYGSLSTLLAGLTDFLDDNGIRTKVEKDAVSISPDFTSGQCKAKISLVFSTGLLRALIILARGGITYIREKAAAEQHAGERLSQQPSESPSANAE